MVNQYTTVGGTTRTHDGNGNLSDDGTQLYGYDFQSRLVRVTNKSTSTVIANYRYDALGRRVDKAIVAGSTTRYILAGPEVVEEYDGSNFWQARYVYEDGIDQPRCMDRADIADVNGNLNTTEVLRFHYHQQALGSVTEMTQPSGAVVEWVVYDVYGQPTIRSRTGGVVGQSAVGNPFLFTGREFDAESGLYFYRARTYDPVAGRFLQRDPLGFVDGLGLYEYCRSQAASQADPHGLETGRARKTCARLESANAALGRAERGVRRAEAQASRTIRRVRVRIRAHLGREPRSGVLPCGRWLRWPRHMALLEDFLRRAEMRVLLAQDTLSAAWSAAEAAWNSYLDAVRQDIQDNGFGGYPPGEHRLTIDGSDYLLAVGGLIWEGGVIPSWTLEDADSSPVMTALFGRPIVAFDGRVTAECAAGGGAPLPSR